MHKNIKIIFNDNIEFEKLWNNFLEKYEHTFTQTLIYQEYLYSYINNLENKSFILLQNNIQVAIVPLFLEKLNSSNSFSISNSYIPIGVFSNKKIEKIAFEYIHNLALELNITQIKIVLNNGKTSYNILKKYNFFETNNLNLTIDLTSSEEKLWSNLSKSFKSLINQYTKNTTHTLNIMNKNNYSWEIFKEFYNFHKYIAKQNARDIKLFEKQYEFVKNGYATLMFIKQDNTYIHFSLFFHYNKHVTYASSVAIKLSNDTPLSHFVLWNANLYFKQKAYKSIEYSSPSGFYKHSGIDDYQNTKGNSIASFKRNMGAIPNTQYRGIKFYDKTLLKNYLDEYYNNYTIDEK